MIRQIFLAAALVLVAASARASDPDLVWRTLETEHFAIHYHDSIHRVAERLALVAEQAYPKITRALDHRPEYRVDVVISDLTDDTNGFAFAYPYAHVALIATSPDDRSELNDYDDYLEHVFTHEFTHIVHVDTISSLWRIVNYLLGFGGNGRILAPNSAQPSFIVEGFAIVEESERTTGGRLRSSIYDMWLRMAALEGKLQRLDQFTNFPVQFPRGNSAHFYGAAFLGFIVDRYGDDTLRKLSHEYGGNWIPGGINRALRRVIGKSYDELYDQFHDELTRRYRAQRRTLQSHALGITPSLALTGPRDYCVRPTFTPDGREVVWGDSNGYSRTQLRAIAVPDADTLPGYIAEGRIPSTLDGGARTFALFDGVGGSSLARDGRTAWVAAEDIERTNYLYWDLYRLDVESGQRMQLTHGLRAAEPDLSPDGKTLAFDINEAGSRSLVTMPTDGGELVRLVSNRDGYSQVYTPAWSPDGKTIAFSWWRDGGFRDLWTVDVASGSLERITSDRALDLDPRFSPDGKYLYFSSDRSGVYNLYAFERATRQVWQVTNVLGGVFDVAIAPDGRRAVYVGFVADGWRLEAIALDPARWVPAAPSFERPPADTLDGIAQLPSHEYHPWNSAWPHTWAVQSYPDAFGQVLQLNLQGQDVVGHHRWALAVGASLARADDVKLAAAYVYNRFYPSLALSGARSLTTRGGLFINGIERGYVEDDYSLSASADFPLVRRLGRAADLAFSYNLVYLRDAHEVKVPLDPNLISPVFPETGQLSSVGASFTWSNTRRYTFSVGSEEGRTINLQTGAALKTLGSKYNVYSASWRWIEYLPLRWSFLPQEWRNHVLSLSYAGGVSGGDLRRRGVYYLGGYGPQPDLLRSAFDLTRPGGAALRGYSYDSIHGDQFHVFNAEYRFPIAWIERGYATAPLYLRRLHGAAYLDYGNAFDGPFDWKRLRLGVGGELRLEVLLGYVIPASLQLGVAHGFDEGGQTQIYFYLNNPF